MNAFRKHPATHFNSVLLLIYVYHLFGKSPSFSGKAIFNSTLLFGDATSTSILHRRFLWH